MKPYTPAPMRPPLPARYPITPMDEAPVVKGGEGRADLTPAQVLANDASGWDWGSFAAGAACALAVGVVAWILRR